MKNYKRYLLGFLMCLVLATTVGCGDKNQQEKDDDVVDDAGDAVEDTVDNAGDAVDDMVDGAGDAVEDTVDGVEDGVDDMTGNGDHDEHEDDHADEDTHKDHDNE